MKIVAEITEVAHNPDKEHRMRRRERRAIASGRRARPMRDAAASG
jgi:hypothetical protein